MDIDISAIVDRIIAENTSKEEVEHIKRTRFYRKKMMIFLSHNFYA